MLKFKKITTKELKFSKMGKRYNYDDIDEEKPSKKFKSKSNKIDKHKKKLIDLARSSNNIQEEEDELYLEYSMGYKNKR